uniref:Uncharacterized protein n=1 Tax=Gasterosteus aculeatus aculeatus TaxID=481459 RepID=A0AAQ4PVB5_GASAC
TRLQLENGFTLSGFRPKQRTAFNKPTHIAQAEEPWSRLSDAATVASSRRSDKHQDPKDSLDFQLESVYDHHKDVFWLKDQVSYQKETFSADLRKETSKQDMLEKETVNDIRVWVDPQRRSIHSIK